MSKIVNDIENYLNVGTPVLMQVHPELPATKRLRTAIRGWRRGQYVIFDRPESSKGVLFNFEGGLPAVVRFLREGMACAFDTDVIDWDSRFQGPSVRVRWPANLECLPFRKSERLQMRVPCTVRTARETLHEGEIEDVSFYGCRLRLRKKLEQKESVELSFQMPDGTSVEAVKALICNVAVSSGDFIAGCEFEKGHESLENDLAFFITTTFERQRMGKSVESRAVRVLLVDSDLEHTRELREELTASGCEVVQAGNAVDALHRLRMAPPAVVLINQQMEDLPGIELGRVIHKHRDFEKTSLYLYGDADGNTAKAAVAAGFLAHFRQIDEIAARIFRDMK